MNKKRNKQNARNSNPPRIIRIADPDAKATPAQRRAIGHAVKEGLWPRFEKAEWDDLRKGRASAIIDEIRSREGDPLASWGQKKFFMELVREGYLRGVKRETFMGLRNSLIKKMIYKGMKNKEAGIFAEPYIHPDEPAAA